MLISTKLSTLACAIFALAMASCAQAEDSRPFPYHAHKNLKWWDYVWIGVATGAAAAILSVVSYIGIKHYITKKREQRAQADIEMAPPGTGATSSCPAARRPTR